jgi:hypothetical protein
MSEATSAPEPAGRRPPGYVDQPNKVVRVTGMLRRLLEEVRHDDLGSGARARLRTIYETSLEELTDTFSDDLRDELERLALPFEQPTPPSEAELRVAQAQLVGWLDGLVRGIEAALRARQVAGAGQAPHRLDPERGGAEQGEPPPSGVYL